MSNRRVPRLEIALSEPRVAGKIRLAAGSGVDGVPAVTVGRGLSSADRGGWGRVDRDAGRLPDGDRDEGAGYGRADLRVDVSGKWVHGGGGRTQ